jgi:molybdate transport system substrate-binding protein
VFAASSLTESFEQLERKFEARHAGVDVQLTFAGSQVLRLQIEQGADADVFASANEAHVQALDDAKLVSDTRPFAESELVVAIPKDNPAQIDSFEQLDRAKRLVIGSENVPVGIYARRMLERSGKIRGKSFEARVRASVVSGENNARLLRAKVELGEADAAIIYRTDAASSTKLRVLSIPSDVNVRANYVLGVVSRSERKDLARSFAAFVLSKEGQNTLTEHGFLPRIP